MQWPSFPAWSPAEYEQLIVALLAALAGERGHCHSVEALRWCLPDRPPVLDRRAL